MTTYKVKLGKGKELELNLEEMETLYEWLTIKLGKRLPRNFNDGGKPGERRKA